MATGVNNNAAVVVVGRTAPVPPGQQTSANSVPVVVASDQSAIPVEEQNKQQSEVALSLLGIPRSEVALGIFADVNTYDVNPTEWSQFPEQFTSAEIYQDDEVTLRPKYNGLLSDADWGLTHIAEEAGAMIEAPPDEYTILTSKRFFRYQPGRVSAATFGVKLNRAPYTVTDNAVSGPAIKNPSIKKYGIFDKFDGYYFESRNDGYGDNFSVVRRTQSIIRDNPLPFGNISGSQDQDYAWTGIPQIQTSSATYPVAYRLLEANKAYLQELAALTGAGGITLAGDAPKCRRDAGLIIEGVLHDLKYGGNASTVYNTLRFFNTSIPGTVSLYVQSGTGPKTANDELARYGVVLDAIKDILAGNAPNTTRTGTPLTISRGGDIGNVTYYSRTNLGIPSTGIGVVEPGASAAVTNLLDNILLRALGKYDTDFNYSSIPSSPSGSAAGELAILRDGLVMIHGAAFDPSLLKERVDYQVVNIIDGASAKYLKVKIPEGAELLQIGQGFSFEANGLDVDLRDTGSTNLVKDGSIWYVSEFTTSQSDLKHRVENQNLYQYIKFSKYPGNEEIYASGNTSNPWVNDSTLAYGDTEVFDLDALRVDGVDTVLGSAVGTESGENTTVTNLNITLKTPTAFVLPSDSRTYAGRQYSDETRPGQEGFPAQYVDGAFPYVYPPGQSAAANSVGYIDSVFQDPGDIKAQINYVNKRIYKNWVWFNVDPKYYKVYEYRVPRSRMSGEKLNGIITDVIYSDNVLSNKAGAPVLDPTTNEQETFTSIWELDPTKVTMYKIEFSWYGAVGATFLAYVPVENNEARWVRVHHLRASNQLKVASLGNATLPITYLAYGGGGENAYGYLNSDRRLNTESGYGSVSEQLTKYGASYYIDGGDRGTVRLFSYASETLKEIGGSRYLFEEANHGGVGAMLTFATDGQDAFPGSSFVNAPYLQFNGSALEFFGSGDASENRPPISDYYMNAKVITSNPTDQDVRVSFVDPVNNKLYLTRTLNATSGNISLVVTRPQPLIGIKCRTEINGVRNRVQIYPTRLATGVTSDSESLAVELIKTPAFQTFDDPGVGSTFAVSAVNGINIGKRGKRVLLSDSDIQITGGDYLQPGQKVYGWFRYTILGDTSGQAFTTLGILDRGSFGKYYFSAYQVTIDEIIIRGKFLLAGRWGGPTGDQGVPLNPDLSSVTTPFPTSTLARLSAIETDTEQRTPIPGTGTTVTTIFSPNSGEEYELSPYFDYNKDYLSFPLTDIQETLYICASSKSTYLQGTNYTARGNILASITWEEQ